MVHPSTEPESTLTKPDKVESSHAWHHTPGAAYVEWQPPKVRRWGPRASHSKGGFMNLFLMHITSTKKNLLNFLGLIFNMQLLLYIVYYPKTFGE